MTLDLSKRDAGLMFRAVDAANGDDDVFVVVHDRTPEWGEMHIEGRRMVEVSAELFVELMAAYGYLVVDPKTGKVARRVKDEEEDE